VFQAAARTAADVRACGSGILLKRIGRLLNYVVKTALRARATAVDAGNRQLVDHNTVNYNRQIALQHLEVAIALVNT